MVWGNHGNDPWYCMYEAYIEARDSTWRDMKMKRSIIVWTSIWLVECSPSLRSECMVLPYLKGLIIKNHFYLYLDLTILGFISVIIYFWIRSTTIGIRATTSGIRALSWANRGIFFFIFAGFLGRRICRSDLYDLGKIWKI